MCISYISYIFMAYALWIKNRSESDLCSYEATKAVAKKTQKKFWGFNGTWTPDLCDTGEMLYQLSYEASYKLVKCEFNLYQLYEESEMCRLYRLYHRRPKLWHDITRLWIMKKCIGDSSRSLGAHFSQQRAEIATAARKYTQKQGM